MRHGSKRLIRKITLAGLSLGAFVQACDGSEAERLTAAHYADRCALDSDCDGGLVCVFEHCHVECNSDKDCSKYGGRCVRVPAEDAEKSSTVGVCQLNEEASCEAKADCRGEQVCAADGQCRDECSSTDKCFSGFACAVSGECARVSELDSGGGLRIRPGAGTGGVTGSGGGGNLTTGGVSDPGSGGSGGDGAAGDMSATGGKASGGKASGGNANGGNANGGSLGGGGAAGTDGGAGGAAAAGGGSGDGYFEGTNEPEPVANNDREHAVPLPSHGSLWLPTGDKDWFYFDAPDDGHPQIVELLVQEAAGERAFVTALGALDNSQIGQILVPEGTSRSVFITVGPGTRTHIAFSCDRPGRLDFDLISVTAERDEYEPNNDRYTAKPVELNTDIIGQQIVPYTSTAGIGGPADWYQVTLAAGAAVVNVVEVPANVGLSISMMDETNTATPVKKLALGVQGIPVPVTIPKAGVYRFELTHHSNSYLDAFYSGVKPESLDKSYKVRFEQ